MVRSCAGYRDDLRDRVWMSLARTPAGLAMSTGEIVTVDSLNEDERFDAPAPLVENGAQSSVAVAIPCADRAHAVLCTHYRSLRGFSLEEQAFVRAFAGMIGLARSSRSRAARREPRTGRFAVVAHDLRNPLAAVEGAMASSALARRRGCARARHSRRSHRTTQRRAHGVADRGPPRSRRAPTRRRRPARAGVHRVRAPARGLRSDEGSRRGTRDRARGRRASARSSLRDRSRVLEVFSNLIGNSAKFTAAGGKIELRADDVEDGTRLEVRDSGRGFPRRSCSACSSAISASRRSTGVGLGLTIAKAIVEAHGGSIGVESEVGVGSSFPSCCHARRAPAAASRCTREWPKRETRRGASGSGHAPWCRRRGSRSSARHGCSRSGG